jgi:hypothetical protein
VNGLRGWLKTRTPSAYPFGTILQHKDHFEGGTYVKMTSLKAMVIGRSEFGHPMRIRVIRLAGGTFVGDIDDVLVCGWEPVDGQI